MSIFVSPKVPGIFLIMSWDFFVLNLLRCPKYFRTTGNIFQALKMLEVFCNSNRKYFLLH